MVLKNDRHYLGFNENGNQREIEMIHVEIEGERCFKQQTIL